MPRVVSHVEVESTPQGGTLHVEPGTIVTPLAREKAQARNVTISESSAQSPSLIRQVTREVVQRMPSAAPETIETVVSEILSSMTHEMGQRYQIGAPDAPSIDVCAACLESERAVARERAVLTVTGRNRRGIVAAVATQLSDLGADILDISQTLVADFFTMIVVFDTRPLVRPFDEARAALESHLAELGMKASVMHEDVLSSLHRV
jgi:ACT domain-containing protein